MHDRPRRPRQPRRLTRRGWCSALRSVGVGGGRERRPRRRGRGRRADQQGGLAPAAGAHRRRCHGPRRRELRCPSRPSTGSSRVIAHTIVAAFSSPYRSTSSARTSRHCRLVSSMPPPLPSRSSPRPCRAASWDPWRGRKRVDQSPVLVQGGMGHSSGAVADPAHLVPQHEATGREVLGNARGGVTAEVEHRAGPGRSRPGGFSGPIAWDGSASSAQLLCA